MMARWLMTILAVFALAAPAHARLQAQDSNGFSVLHEAQVSSSPREAYDAFVSVGSWWDVSHSYSGKPENLKLNAVPGGAWIETLPDGGFVNHLLVAQADPGKRLVLNGGLGPLAFMGVNGAMTVTFAASETGTKVRLVYNVGGFDKDGFTAVSKAVDGVLEAQFAHYVSYANSVKR